MNTHTTPSDHEGDFGGEEDRLPCGRHLADVWTSAERREDDPHPASCGSCRRAVEDLERLESVVRGLRDESERTVPDTASLTRRVMDVVRLELRPGRPLPLGAVSENLWIMESVAARALRGAAESVPGVRAGSCRFHSPSPDAPPVVRVEVHAPAGQHLPAVAESISRAVHGTADRSLGMPVAVVDIVIADIVGSPADDREGQSC
ncbi:Asp23/Gls24 family envelope stress response protein [Streptomyces sp. NPDC096030]|uniref:Asp23/Gls24 family envelope stress response protein n=1 Tax=Streptomyces sp. NPDC096030 TaxID=3155423 RepID=UPI00331C8C39